MKKITAKVIPFCFYIGIAIYILSIIIFNYNGKVFYNFDMNADANIAKMMCEQKALFPDGFIFGNQFYVVATPVLSALLYTFIKDSFFSLATASCLMMLFTILSFLYCFDYKADKKSVKYGLFCLVGGTVVGSGACSYINGLQVFFTMASYYSCYLIGILLTLGIYLRLKKSERCSKIWMLFVLAYNFALNMHSLRQMLVCCIPIFCFEAASLFFEFVKCKKIKATVSNNKKSIIFVILVMFSAIGGIILIRNIDILSEPIIEELKIEFNPHEILLNAKNSLMELAENTGVLYYQKGIRFLPLTLLALFLIAVVVTALVMMVINREKSIPANVAYFSVISVFGVFFVGTFLMQVRSIYFFVWYLLVASCVIYLCNKLKGNLKYIFLSLLLIAGAGNYVYNFGFDAMDYINQNSAYEQLVLDLKEMGVKNVYTMDSGCHKIAVYSNDEISIATLDTDYIQKSGYPLIPITYLQKTDAFVNVDYESNLLMLDDDFWKTAKERGGEEYIENLQSKLELCHSCEIEDAGVFYFYRMISPVFPEESLV